MALTIHKVVSALPGTLVPDAVYAVRTGVGFDLYIADSTGNVAHKINDVSSTGAVISVGTTPPSDTTQLWLDTN